MIEVIYAVYGASGLGREVLPLARAQLKKKGISAENLVFVDDNVTSKQVNHHPVLTRKEFLNHPAKHKYATIAIANSIIREKLSRELTEAGVIAWSIFADNCEIMDEVVIGEGALISPFALLASNTKIGKYFHANYYSQVAHDCIIGDFVTFAPGVRCNGNIHIYDHAYIGAGAMIRQGTPDKPLRIGKGAVVGMGAVVLQDVPAGVTVVGNPAKPLIKK